MNVDDARDVQQTKVKEAPLSRDRILDAALRLVDARGLDALSMRHLGAELGVEAMSIYYHVPSKDVLLSGLAARLWDEVRLPADGVPDWKAAVRPIVESLRQVARDHPNAYTLLMAQATLPEPALEVFDVLLKTLRGAGFDDKQALHALGTLIGYGAGYATLELACGLCQPDQATRCCVAPDAGGRFAEVARSLTECDSDSQFAFGLEVILDGLEARLRT